MKKKILQLGYGYWGKILYKKIKKKYDVKLIKNRLEFKKKKNKLNPNNFALVILSASNNQNIKLIKFFAGKVCKIFCEKPLSKNPIELKKIFNLCRKKKTDLFVSEIEIFKNKRINNYQNNFVIRGMLRKYKNIKSLLFSIVYHDIYLHIKYCNLKNIKKISYDKVNNNFIIRFKSNLKNYVWIYKSHQKQKYHLVNGTNYSDKSDFILNMINKVIKQNSFYSNNLRALKATEIANKMLENNEKR